jgi:cytochrome c-type biogenesis protein CcmH
MTEHWTAAISVLASGIGFGFVASAMTGRPSPARGGKSPRKGGSKDTGGELLDVAARQEVALSRLRELEEGNAAFSSEAAVAERRRLEIEAAKALRDLEERRTESSKARSESLASSSSILSHRWLWGLGSAACAAAVVLGLQSFSAPREAGRPMTGGTGAMPMAASAAPAEVEAPMDAAVAGLRRRVDEDPENINLRLDLADAYLKTVSGSFEGFEQSKIVLAKDPENPRALVQQAAVRALMGQQGTALQLAERAVARDPKLENGWIQRGRSALALGQRQVAIESFEKAIALNPLRAAELEAPLQAARGQLASPAPEDNNGPAAKAAPPAAGSAISQGNPAQAAITGTVDIDPSVASRLPPGGFVFVVARQDGGGPRPLAAKRLPAQGFPLSFRLSQEDAVMGGTLPDHVNIEARWDADGNAFTRDPSDPVARQSNVALGTGGVALVLRAP